MPDPQILDVLGIEIEIRIWRGVPNIFEATFTKADGSALDLTNRDATFVLVDRPGGNVKLAQTKEPGQHISLLGGVTRFSVDADVTAALTGQRLYTWKYHVLTRDRTTNQPQIHFYGDARIVPPTTPV